VDNEIQGYIQLCTDSAEKEIQGYNHVTSNQANRPKANQIEPVKNEYTK